MAGTPPNLASTVLIALLLSVLVPAVKTQEFTRKLRREELGIKSEKLTHLHFFFHDISTGKNPTSFRVAQAAITNNSATGFGAVAVADDPLTVGPNITTKHVGKAQGIFSSAAQDEIGFLMVMNFAFVEGKFNGSTLSMLGRNNVSSTVREMPIVGGSGHFRFARGFALAKTYTPGFETGNAVVEYNVYVFHY